MSSKPEPFAGVEKTKTRSTEKGVKQKNQKGTKHPIKCGQVSPRGEKEKRKWERRGIRHPGAWQMTDHA